MDNGLLEIFCFTLCDIHLAIPLNRIQKVVRAVAITPVPNAPHIFHGLVNFHGKIIPVINLRHRFNLKEIDVSPDQIFLIANTLERQVALVADAVEGVVISKNEDVYPAGFLNQPIEAFGVLRSKEGMIFIYDIEKFLQTDEIIQLEKAIVIENVS